MPASHAVLFDLDGTLIDSIDLIVNSARHAFEKCGHPMPTREEWIADLGMPLRAMFGRFIADESTMEQLVAGYREYQLANHDRLVRPYEEVTSTLQALHGRGYELAVVTSKSEPLAKRGLAHVGLEGFFDVIVGLESCTRHNPTPSPYVPPSTVSVSTRKPPHSSAIRPTIWLPVGRPVSPPLQRFGDPFRAPNWREASRTTTSDV